MEEVVGQAEVQVEHYALVSQRSLLKCLLGQQELVPCVSLGIPATILTALLISLDSHTY